MKVTFTLHEDQYAICSHLAQFFLEWNFFRQSLLAQQTHIFMFNNAFFFKLRPSLNNVEKYGKGRTGHK
jgi:hypothetical protein